MSNSRRDFVLTLSAALLAAESHASAANAQPPFATPPPVEQPPGAPSTIGTASPAGPDVSSATFAAAEKLMQVTMTDRERTQAAENWRGGMATLYERRTGPRKVELGPGDVPYSQCNPVLPGHAHVAPSDRFVAGNSDPGPLPSREDDIAFAPMWKLAHWIRSRRLTSQRLTQIYLTRIERLDARLRSIITVTRELALAQAARADREIAAGRYRGPLHGIPWGAKDLLDTAGIATTYGAEPFRHRTPAVDATVVRRLHDAGAVLVAKLSMGALALNDIWFGGQTMNPWLPEEGASGSSAGPGAATAAGLVAFSIGSETEGSIVSPSMRCGVTGLRPTFGRVPRTGSMTVSWSMDKLGPMTRNVEDAMLVLRAIAGADAGDIGSATAPLAFDAGRPVKGLRVGYVASWMDEPPATDVDRAALQQAGALGMVPVKVTLPDWPYGSLNAILFAEAAAAFEALTLEGRLDELAVQAPDAWPNTARQSRFISAVDLIQADRMRRRVAKEMERILSGVDLLLVPSLRDEMLAISNYTGHPSLTIPAGFVQVSQARSDWAPDPARPLPSFDPPRRVPHGITLVGRLFDEGTIARAGLAFERALGVANERPPGF